MICGLLDHISLECPKRNKESLDDDRIYCSWIRVLPVGASGSAGNFSKAKDSKKTGKGKEVIGHHAEGKQFKKVDVPALATDSALQCDDEPVPNNGIEDECSFQEANAVKVDMDKDNSGKNIEGSVERTRELKGKNVVDNLQSVERNSVQDKEEFSETALNGAIMVAEVIALAAHKFKSMVGKGRRAKKAGAQTAFVNRRQVDITSGGGLVRVAVDEDYSNFNNLLGVGAKRGRIEDSVSLGPKKQTKGLDNTRVVDSSGGVSSSMDEVMTKNWRNLLVVPAEMQDRR